MEQQRPTPPPAPPQTAEDLERALGKIPNTPPPERLYDVVLIEGECTLSAHGCTVIDGALCFLDVGGEIRETYAPGEWHSMERCDSPKKEVEAPRKGVVPGSPGYGPGPAS